MTEFRWQRTNAPLASSRTDDIWFADADRGWAVNSNGHILHTADGGQHWARQYSAAGIYLRCLGFAGDQIGWVGTLAEERPLIHTTDGGATWAAAENLPADAPPAICGLCVVDAEVVYASGTNFPDQPTGVIKTLDGGETWTAIDMNAQATMLIDIFFRDAQRGWVVGGKADGVDPAREDVTPIVLATEDGGATWTNRLAGLEAELPKGEWGWKIDFVDDEVGFVSLENAADGAVLKTVDGGATWQRKVVNDPQNNANLEGIGFLDREVGWTGGWGDENFEGGFTSETRDGGETWTDANHVGKFINRFRFIREPELVGYASGDTVYRYSAVEAAEPAVAGPAASPPPIKTSLPLRLPRSDRAPVRFDVWDRFGRHLATGEGGEGELTWAGETNAGVTARPGVYIVRVTGEDWSESRTVALQG